MIVPLRNPASTPPSFAEPIVYFTVLSRTHSLLFLSIMILILTQY